ncbi:MAG: DUF5666 domain-containing protein [Microgenomates group bacterium]
MVEKNNQNQLPLKNIIIITLVIFLILFAFILGLKLGRREFYYRYPPFLYPVIKPPKEGFIPRRFRSHGLVGKVDSIGKESFVVKSRWGELVTVLIDKNTQFKKDSKNATFSDIKKGQEVLVIGKPEEQELAIKAKIIRIF